MRITVSARWAAAAAAAGSLGVLLVAAGCGSSSNSNGLPGDRATADQVARGRYLVLGGACSDCHNRGVVDPGDPHWLAGYIGPTTGGPPGSFVIGPPPGFLTFAANITPDTTTGIGRFTDRQIFNAFRYGLDPSVTPDVVITSTTPGQGNFPATPHYLAPPMPWPTFRHLSDSDLWSIVAYIKHGIKPVANVVPDSQGPADFWRQFYTTVGPFPLPAYPAGNEQFNP